MTIHALRRRALLALAAMGCGALVALTGPLPAVAGAGSSLLAAGESLTADRSIRSADGRFTAAMQGDGNFVLYGPSGALWSTRTGGQPGASIAMQSNGNLVVSRNGAQIWQTGTTGYNGASLAVQNDGNLVLYHNGNPLWAESWHTTRGDTRGSNGGVAGNCTWYAYEQFKQFTGVYAVFGGDAFSWNENAVAHHWLVIGQPATQAVVVFERGVHSASSSGHVAWVREMRPHSGGGTDIHVFEMNFVNFNVVSDRWVQHVSGMSYIMAPQL